MKFTVILTSLLIVLSASNASGYNILGVFHTTGKSHYILAVALMKGLAEAGHNVTMVSPFKLDVPVKNMREIVLDLPPAHKFSKLLYHQSQTKIFEQLETVLQFGLNFTDDALMDPSFQELLKSGEKFDVAIVELFLSEALLGIGKVFDAPMIGFCSFGASKWSTDLNGSPSPLSYVPHTQFTFTDRMTFLQRMANTMLSIFEKVYLDINYNYRQEALYNKHFTDPKPDFDYLKRTSLSMVLLNAHFSMNYPRPYLPNMVEIGGFHIKNKPKPLPKDLQEFLDTSPNGVIYFSMGSNLKSADLPTEARDALLRVFGRLNVRVMWKWEDDTLPGKPENVLIRKWFPQDDILAHPKVRFFITHGGLLSTTEATYHGVPVLGIPVFGDQMMNMGKTQAAGYGVTVGFTNLTEESISWAINELLSNDKYSIRAKTISARFRDQPEDPLSRAVYWIEYVARHGGAKHLISGGQELSFIQYHNLDVFAVLLAVPILFLMLICRLLKRLFKKKSSNVGIDKKYK
ncbi:UDP-glycosyltransferase UGT5-like [Phlebotomus argentipes]|uniref:UDP-glycosyltransferase UGT5-like n=1 Tax=Phlebotomus argentipes TaxID=94469 RepID=UPI00289371EF|nr:UDP-glycosyltransferase UGT5-like [Phlebotomus argentipes]